MNKSCVICVILDKNDVYFSTRKSDYLFQMVKNQCCISWQLHVQNNNGNTRTRCEICSKLTIKTPERRHFSISIPPENARKQRFSVVFTGYRNGTLARNESLQKVYFRFFLLSSRPN